VSQNEIKKSVKHIANRCTKLKNMYSRHGKNIQLHSFPQWSSPLSEKRQCIIRNLLFLYIKALPFINCSNFCRSTLKRSVRRSSGFWTPNFMAMARMSLQSLSTEEISLCVSLGAPLPTEVVDGRAWRLDRDPMDPASTSKPTIGGLATSAADGYISLLKEAQDNIVEFGWWWWSLDQWIGQWIEKFVRGQQVWVPKSRLVLKTKQNVRLS